MPNGFSTPSGGKTFTLKDSKSGVFGWNQTQKQSVTATWTVKKRCNVFAFSLIDMAGGTEYTEVLGQVRLNGEEPPGRVTSAWYRCSAIYAFEANPGDVITVLSQGKTTKAYGAVNAFIYTDE